MIIEIVIRHAREDERLLKEFTSHLKPLERTGCVSVFHEDRIRGGEFYNQSILMQMQRAHIILPLISHHFVASDAYVEMERALLCPKQVSARIIPIILRAVDWQTGPFGLLRALPENNIPVRKWPDRDSAWLGIVEHIRTIVAELSN